MAEILREYLPVKRERPASQTTLMMNEVVRLTSGAEVLATLMEHSLRYLCIAHAAAEDDE